MSAAAAPAGTDRNVDGILNHIRDYLRMREEQAVRINPRLAGIIEDIAWVQVQNLRRLLEKPKAFGGEKYRVADILASADDAKRKALLGTVDQNSIVSEIINRAEEQTKRVADLTIHDMRTLFRMIDPSLENIVQLIQHWIYWDLPDASDLHHFDEQARRIDTLRNIDLSDDLRGKYRPALGKSTDQAVSDAEVLNFEFKRLETISTRFVNRRNEDEPFQMIIGRDDEAGEPYDYKRSQSDKLRQRLENERQMVDLRLQPAQSKPLATPTFPAAQPEPATSATPAAELQPSPQVSDAARAEAPVPAPAPTADESPNKTNDGIPTIELV